MNRRRFVKKGMLLSVAPSALYLLSPFSSQTDFRDQSTKPAWLVEMIHRNDQNLENIRRRRVDDPKDPLYGAVLDGTEIATPHAVTSFIKTALCCLTSPESKWFNNIQLTGDLTASAEFLLSLQHGDGTIDLVTTNFHSTPDTGFLVKYLCPAVGLLQKSEIEGKAPLLNLLKEFLLRAGDALMVGGIHTPNHRWVVCGALGCLNLLWPNPEYLKRAETWLAEGIDMDEDGQYQEKSSYIYSSLSDRVLISTARGFNKPELLDYVRENLEMTFYYIHPNGEIVTEASGRQDNSIVGYLENYYYPYRYLAIKDQNRSFAAACRLIETTAPHRIAGFLPYFLEDSNLWQELPEPAPLPVNYFKHFVNSSLVRIRRGNYDASILPKNTSFFNFHKTNAVLQGIRLASAFFGKGQFVADKYRVENGKITMESFLEGPYYQPFPQNRIPGDGVWEKMPRNERAHSEVQKLHTKIIVSETENGFELEFSVQGTDRVPLAVELIFRRGGQFENVENHEEMPDSYFLKDGYGKYVHGDDVIEFGPGQYEHKWINIRGGLPRMDAPTLFLTGFTPFHRKIRVS